MTINSVNLKRPYLSKKIGPDTLKTVLNSTYQTAYRLYLITNEIEELQQFIEVEHPGLWVTATVKTVAAPTGAAKRQIWAIKHLTPLLQKRPNYTLKCNVRDKQTNKELYGYELVTINENTIYSQIQQCIVDIKEIIDEKDY